MLYMWLGNQSSPLGRNLLEVCKCVLALDTGSTLHMTLGTGSTLHMTLGTGSTLHMISDQTVLQ